MNRTDRLFHLVKSLSKAEKRHFRLVASQYDGQKKYMALFDQLDRADRYDEESIRRRVDPGADPKQFHVIKNYLLELILKSLRSFDTGSSKRIRFQRLLSNISILYNRGIFTQGERLLKSAEKIAEELDNPALKLEVIDLRLRLLGYLKTKQESIEDIYTARMEHVRDMELRYRYLCLRATIEEQMAAALPHKPVIEIHGTIDSVTDSEPNHLPPPPPPAEASLAVWNLYYQALSLFHYAKGDERAALRAMIDSKEVYDGNPTKRSSYISEYIILLGNILQLLLKMEEYNLHANILADLMNISDEQIRVDVLSATRAKVIYLETIYSAQLHLHVKRGEFERCLPLESEIKVVLKDAPIYRHQSNRHHHLFLLSYAHFGLKNYDSALQLLHNIVNRREPDRGRSLYYSARLLQMLIHFELENYDLVESLERSLRSRLLDQRLMGKYEAEVLRFFREAISTSPLPITSSPHSSAMNGKGKTHLWDSERFDPAAFRATNGTTLFPDIPFADWIESKKSGRTLSEVIGQRLLRKGKNK